VEARKLVEETLLARLTVVPLTEADYLDAIRRVSHGGLASGVVYDALHVCCAERIPVDRILTYNLADFERLRPAGIVVVGP
jgi:predicted nucleic acid-binding protein